MHEILLYITFFSGLVPFCFYVFIIYRKGNVDNLKPAVPFLWLTLIGSLYEPIVTIGMGKDSMYWFRIYNVAEFLCLYYFFTHVIHKRYLLVFGSFFYFFIVSSLLVVILDVGQLRVESIYAPLIFIFVLTFSTLWFRDTSKNDLLLAKFAKSNVVFICGFLLYYAGTLFFYLLSEVILVDSKSIGYHDYWLVNIIATLILKCFLIGGVWSGKKI